MLIHCTKKLLDELKIAPSVTPDDCDPLFSWRAHIISVNRRKTVVLMCDLSRYVVVLYGLKAKDFKELSAYNRDLSFTPYACWAAEVMAEALGETVEADSSGCCNWFRVGDAVTVFYNDDMDYAEFRETGMLA